MTASGKTLAELKPDPLAGEVFRAFFRAGRSGGRKREIVFIPALAAEWRSEGLSGEILRFVRNFRLKIMKKIAVRANVWYI